MTPLRWFAASVIAALILWWVFEWLQDAVADVRQAPLDEWHWEDCRGDDVFGHHVLLTSSRGGTVRMTAEQARGLGLI